MKYFFVGIFICLLVLISQSSKAAKLTLVSDTLTNPNPSTVSNHTINFTATSAIPVSGKIVITPRPGTLNIPASLTSTDVDFKINGIEFPVASFPGTGAASAIGFSFVSGTSGSLTFTLNDTDAVGAGEVVNIEIGTNATFGGVGSHQITNPSTLGSHLVNMETQNAGSVTIDTGYFALAIVNSVTITGTPLFQAEDPVITPNGGVFLDSVNVTITDSTPGASIYYTLDGSIPTVGSLLYSGSFSITQTTNVQAIAVAAGLTDSNVVSVFISINKTPTGGVGNPGIPDSNTPGQGAIVFTDNSGQATINTYTSKLVVHTCTNGAKFALYFPDNAVTGTAQVNINCYSTTYLAARGMVIPQKYVIADTVFGVSVTDYLGRLITTFPKPLTFEMSYTNGQRSGVLANTMIGQKYNFVKNTWEVLSGSSIDPVVFKIGGSLWELNTQKLSNLLDNRAYFTTVADQILETPAVTDCSDKVKADLNCDGFVDLTDFSILMYNWNRVVNNFRADINKDGRVDLADLSILLYYWS